jgi:hypothetical protein
MVMRPRHTLATAAILAVVTVGSWAALSADRSRRRKRWRPVLRSLDWKWAQLESRPNSHHRLCMSP